MTDAPRLVAFTVDVEPDYGGIFGPVYHTLQDDDVLDHFKQTLKTNDIPVTLFITGDLLERHLSTTRRISEIGSELQVHSYSHPGPGHDVIGEARRARDAYTGFYGRPPSGYRSPFGYIHDDCLSKLADIGYRYDSSLFPTLRPGRFYNLGRSLFPVRTEADFWELPLGCFAGSRLVFSVGYLKFFGPVVFRILLRLSGIPNILIIDSHMHDFIPTELYRKLPVSKRLRYARNKLRGLSLLVRFIHLLRSAGYRTVCVEEIVDRLEGLRENRLNRVIRL